MYDRKKDRTKRKGKTDTGIPTESGERDRIGEGQGCLQRHDSPPPPPPDATQDEGRTTRSQTKNVHRKALSVKPESHKKRDLIKESFDSSRGSVKKPEEEPGAASLSWRR